MIDKLEFVLALARERHFGRAAESCGVTQPTLSAGLKSLEGALGVLIVKRSSRFQGFTPEGERVLVWARRMVGDAKAMRQDLDSMSRSMVGHLTIGVIPTALPVVAQLTGPLQDRHPGLGFTVVSRPSADILALLDNLSIDAGLSYLDNEPLGDVRTVPLYHERYCLFTADGALFRGRASVTWLEAGGVPLCLPTTNLQNRRIIDALLRASGVEPHPSLVSDSTIVLASHVASGRWASILPPMLAQSLGLSDRVRCIPIVEPDVAHQVGLIVSARDPLSSIIAALSAETRKLSRRLERQPAAPA